MLSDVVLFLMSMESAIVYSTSFTLYWGQNNITFSAPNNVLSQNANLMHHM